MIGFEPTTSCLQSIHSTSSSYIPFLPLKIPQFDILSIGAQIFGLLTTLLFYYILSFLNGYHFYELGITNSEVVNIPDYSRTIKRVLRNHSLYSEIDYFSNNKKTFVNAGLRLNYIETFDTFNIEPRIQALQKLNKYFSFKIAGEFKSQNATQIIDLQEDFLGVEKRRWILADNSTIPIIKSKQASAGFNFKRQHIFVLIMYFVFLTKS